MNPEEFRAAGHRLIDWIADYRARAESLPVMARTGPGDVRQRLPAQPPDRPEPFDAIVRDLDEIIVPGLSHWQHPRFFGYFPCNGSLSSVLGDYVSTGLGVLGLAWQSSPALTELEEVVTDWMRGMLGLSVAWSGVIQDTASTSTLVALAAAREAVPGLEVRRRGLVGQARLRMYASDQAHSSVEKAGIVLGIGQDGLRTIPVDDEYRMQTAALARAITEDRAAGFTPFAVTATVGTTSTTSIDPVPAIADVCAREGLWLHVDTAYAGSAAAVPELRWVLAGCERADSLVVNPHKWMFVPVDLSVLYTRRPEVVRQAFSVLPEYLKTAEDAEAPNLMDYGVSLGRRFRALKLWMVIRAFGAEGIAARLREHVRLAGLFRALVEADPGFEIAAPAPLSVVCFRARFSGNSPEEQDRRNAEMMEAVNATGEAYLSHTRLKGRTVLRLAVGNLRTEERHVRRAFELLQEAAGRR